MRELALGTPSTKIRHLMFSRSQHQCLVELFLLISQFKGRQESKFHLLRQIISLEQSSKESMQRMLAGLMPKGCQLGLLEKFQILLRLHYFLRVNHLLLQMRSVLLLKLPQQLLKCLLERLGQVLLQWLLQQKQPEGSMS